MTTRAPSIDTTTATGMLGVDGAELYYEAVGRGPSLVFIAGAGGDGGYFSQAANALADAFRVVTYDRRGNSRSTGRREAEMTIAEQVADAKAVIDACAGGRALVYGNSGGAILGLALVAEHPEAVVGLIAHEPPIVTVLPADDPDRSTLDDLLQVLDAEGVMATAAQFVQGVRGEGTYEWPPDVLKRFGDNLEHLFTKEFAAFAAFTPDLDALSRTRVPIIMAAGAEDRGLYYARPSLILAERLGVPWAELPGYHLPFMERPAEFAAALRGLATCLSTQLGGIPDEWRRAPS
jgi:pimeloyl-ACP methyl ester carboxylesterase